MNRLKTDIDKYLKHCIPDICMILGSGRRDIDVIAILLTEAFFRRRLIRIIEFFCYKILKIFRCPRSYSISLGMAQVQSRYWRIPITIFGILSPTVAYDVTIRYWDENKIIGLPLLEKIAKHVGEIRFYYLEIALRCRDEAQKWSIYFTEQYYIEKKLYRRQRNY